MKKEELVEGEGGGAGAGAAWDGVYEEAGQWYLDGQVRLDGFFFVEVDGARQGRGKGTLGHFRTDGKKKNRL